MIGRPRVLLLVGCLLVAAGCSSPTVPTDPPTAQPRSTIVATNATLPTAVPSPTISSTPTSDTGAELVVIGDGRIACNSPGGCGAVLFLQPSDDGPLPTSLNYEAGMKFAAERPTYERLVLLGPVAGAPTRLAVGRWLIGVGQSYSSDAATCDNPCASYYFESGTVLLCTNEFEVGEGMDEVVVHAHFSPNCSIDVSFGTTIID